MNMEIENSSNRESSESHDIHNSSENNEASESWDNGLDNPIETSFHKQLLEHWTDYFEDAEDPIRYDDSDYRHHLLYLLFQSYYEGNETYRAVYRWQRESSQTKRWKRNIVLPVHIDYREFIQNQNGAVQAFFTHFTLECLDMIATLNLALDRINELILKNVTRRIRIRIFNYATPRCISTVDSSQIGQFIEIKAIVFRLYPRQLLTTKGLFNCPICKTKTPCIFRDGKYEIPAKCKNATCANKNVLIFDQESAHNLLYQRIHLQADSDQGMQLEKVGLDQKEVFGKKKLTKQPNFSTVLECELQEELVDSLRSGERVIIGGVLKAEKKKTSADASEASQSIYTSYLEVNSVTVLRDISQEEEEISDTDLGLFKNLSQDFNLFYLMIKSFCPTIAGNELVKAGLLLTILAGDLDPESDNENLDDQNGNDQKIDQSINKVSPEKFDQSQHRVKTDVRTESHAILIGDPGLGKSQLLKFTTLVSPHCIYVCGNGVTNAGLTITVINPGQGDGTLEGGALVLCDRGVCCIDEFDKMPTPLGLLEAMEQQTITINKSGVRCSFSTRATIIASTNAIGGKYNRLKSLQDNVKILPALLDRFDLMFVLCDDPNRSKDQELSEHILKLHNIRGILQSHNESASLNEEAPNRRENSFRDMLRQMRMKSMCYLCQLPMSSCAHSDQLNVSTNENEFKSLTELIREGIAGLDDFRLGITVMRKYITYVKRHIHPSLSSEAAAEIQSFYLALRKDSERLYHIKTTVRHLHSAIRLSRARAKIDGRCEVSRADAQEVIKLIQESLFDALEEVQETKSAKKPQDRKGNATGNRSQSQKQKTNAYIATDVSLLSTARQLKTFLAKLSDDYGRNIILISQLRDCARALNVKIPFDELIAKLNNTSLMKRGPGVYQLT